ncbi:MAG: tol-pal system protein YbgF [Zetaproteobacteria bacterium CG_4_9_14_3_um_filter_53_7]|nr:MAG: tol-pal system protein YbgF [Zetaproteobacteria bacterium CG_4_9_14_3_um_filter_53_7]
MAVLLLCAGVLSGCANNDKKVTWAQDKDTVIRAVHDIRENQQASEAAALESAAATETQLQILAEENQKQQQQIDSLTAQIKAMQAVRKTVAVKAAPVAVVKEADTQSRTTQVKAPTAESVPVPQVDSTAEMEAEKNAYTAAYLALKSGRFDEASTAFNTLLDKYPAGEHADQAWYWLGETRYAQHDYESALLAFKYVTDHYAGSVKHAAALLKMGQILEAQKKPDSAVAYYNRLIKEHVDSTPAEQARDRLTEIRAKQDVTPANPATENQ